MCQEKKQRLCNTCGIILSPSIESSEKRLQCKYCRKAEVKENYWFKREVYSYYRRKRRAEDIASLRFDKCIICGEEFSTRRKKQVTCGSETCQTKHRQNCNYVRMNYGQIHEGTCLICKTSFTSKRSYQVTCCSETCKKELSVIRKREERQKLKELKQNEKSNNDTW